MAPKETQPSPADVAWRFGAVLLVGIGIALVPAPAGVTPAGWNTFAVFVATITGFLLRPLPMGPMVLLALVVLGATGTLTFKRALTAYADTTVWLVVAAFLLAGAMQRTGLGRRIALYLVHRIGGTTLGLGYAACAAELILGPVIPSNTARGGGVMAPISRSLSVALGSEPLSTPRRAGDYLTLVGAHANLISAAMFLTGMAANPLVAKAAIDNLGLEEFGWLTWLKGSIVPGLVSMALLPLFLYKLAPPELKDARPAQAQARQQLAEMGAWSYGEKAMLLVFLGMLALWCTKPLHGLGTGLVAWMGVVTLFIVRADEWADASGDAAAWDALIWLGGLITMAGVLKEEGVVAWFAGVAQTQTAGFSGVLVALLLTLVYFYSMYGFSMLTGHIAAMVGAFFTVAIAAHAPPMLTAALFAYFGCLCACTTNYSTGPVIIYFGLGYVPATRWFRIGFLVSLFHLAVWLGVGLPWWKLLGWW